MSGYSIQEVINRNEQDVEREAGRTLSDKDLLMEELRNLQEGRTLSDRDMVPRMQGGGPTLPPAVPAVGGGLPSVADNGAEGNRCMELHGEPFGFINKLTQSSSKKYFFDQILSIFFH